MHAIGSQVLLILGFLACYSLAVINFKHPKCHGKEIKMSDKEKDGMSKCIHEIAPDLESAENMGKASEMMKGKLKDKINCLGKCIMKVEGVLDDKEIPSKDLLMKKLNDTMKDDVVKELGTELGKCIDDNAKSIDPKEASCSGYKGVIGCFVTVLTKVCENPKDS